jgi:hypothetical protein
MSCDCAKPSDPCKHCLWRFRLFAASAGVAVAAVWLLVALLLRLAVLSWRSNAVMGLVPSGCAALGAVTTLFFMTQSVVHAAKSIRRTESTSRRTARKEVVLVLWVVPAFLSIATALGIGADSASRHSPWFPTGGGYSVNYGGSDAAVLYAVQLPFLLGSLIFAFNGPRAVQEYFHLLWAERRHTAAERRFSPRDRLFSSSPDSEASVRLAGRPQTSSPAVEQRRRAEEPPCRPAGQPTGSWQERNLGNTGVYGAKRTR